jgi:hypothetical protein
MSFLNVAQTKNPPIFPGGFWILMIALIQLFQASADTYAA